MKLLKTLTLSSLALAACCLSARAEVCQVQADTYGSPITQTITKAAGAATTLAVSSKSTAYIDFIIDPTQAIDPATVTDARLVLYFTKVVKPGTMTLTVNGSQFFENFSAKTIPTPTVQSMATTFPVAVTETKNFVVVDVTAQVKAWLSGAVPEFGFGISGDATVAALIGSKEGTGSGYPATLEIDVTPGGVGYAGPIYGGTGSFLDEVDADAGFFTGNVLIGSGTGTAGLQLALNGIQGLSIDPGTGIASPGDLSLEPDGGNASFGGGASITGTLSAGATNLSDDLSDIGVVTIKSGVSIVTGIPETVNTGTQTLAYMTLTGSSITVQHFVADGFGGLLAPGQGISPLYIGDNSNVLINSRGGPGFVGIDTINPKSTLDVAGNTRVEGTGNAFSLYLSGTDEGDFALSSGAGSYSTEAALGDVVIRGDTGKLLLQTGNGSSSIAIAANHNVGIGTSTPSADAKLQVNGMVRMGSGTGTSEPPDKPILVRRIRSTNDAAGQIVARCVDLSGNAVTLERDGTPGGLQLRFSQPVGAYMLVGTAVVAQQSTVLPLKYVFYSGASGVNAIVSDLDNVESLHLTFGDSFDGADTTEVDLIHFADGGGNDSVNWVGTVTSTVNQ